MTFSALKTEIADYLDRDDLSDAVLAGFIAKCESRLRFDVRHWRMQNRATTTVSAADQYIELPADWIETISVRINGDPVALSSVDTIDDKRAANSTTGQPSLYAIAENALHLYPSADAEYTMEIVYLQSIPALSDVTTTNWLLDYHPDIYLYGSLVHTAAYLQEDERIVTWAKLYDGAVTKLNNESEQAKWSGSGLRLKVRGLG